jgi:hypothetical protein
MNEDDIERDLRERCESIRDDLQAIYDFMQTDEFNEVEDYYEDERTLDHFLQDVLDVEYFVGDDGSFRGVELLVAYGGPNIVIKVHQTYASYVKGGWGSSKAEVYLPTDLDGMVLDYYEDKFYWDKQIWK